MKLLEKDLSVLNVYSEEAMQAIRSVSRSDVTELKSFGNPPEIVQKFLMDLSFLNKVTNCDPRNTPDANLKSIAEIVSLEDFDPEIVEESSSAAKFLCSWCRAINKYLFNYQRLKPKLVVMEEVKVVYEESKYQLNLIEEELRGLTKEIAVRTEKKDAAEKERQELISKQDKLKAKITHTGSLVDYLRNHNMSWEDNLKNLEKRASIIKGNSLLSAACIEYLGMFETKQRDRLKDAWKKSLGSMGIKFTIDFKLHKFLGNKLNILAWRLAGLPPSVVNLENAIMLQSNRKAKVVYDPNDTCLDWMRKMNTKDQGEVQVTSIADPKISQKMQSCLEKGQTLIIDFFNGDLGGLISSLLNPAFRIIEGQKTIKIDEMWYNYSDKFDFYLITRDRNVCTLPDVQIKCCVVKFCLDDEGLLQSLKSQVTQIFDPELEKERFEQNKSSLEKKRIIIDNQEKILKRLVVNTDESLLEDEEYLDMLTTYATLTTKLEREIENEKAKLSEDQEVTLVDKLVLVLLEAYKTVEKFSGAERFLQQSVNNFMRTVNKSVVSLEISSIDHFTRENILLATSQVFNIITGAARSETRLFMLVDLCVSILKIFNEFRQDIWTYIITPKNKRQSSEAESLGLDLEPSVWQSLRNLQLLIPSLELEHLPVLVSTFQQIPKMGLQAAIKEAVSKTEQLTSIERLALSISFLPDNFHLCLEIFTEDVLPGVNRTSTSIETVLQKCDYNQPLIFIQGGSCDFTSIMSRINSSMKTQSTIIFCGNTTWDKVRLTMDKAAILGHVVILCEFHLCPQLHESTSRYMREINSKHKLDPGFRLVLTTPPEDQGTTVELISMSIKLLDSDDTTNVVQLPLYYSGINFEKVKFASVKVQNIIINTVLAYFVMVNRAKYGTEGFVEPVRLTDLDLRSLSSFLSGMVRLNPNVDASEGAELENFLFYFIFSQMSNPLDEAVARWFLSNAFVSDSKAGIYLRNADSIRDVLDEIQTLQIEPDRLSGINPDSIEEFKRKKAAYFSRNIINLEKKDYSAITPISHIAKPAVSTGEVNLQQIVKNFFVDLDLPEEPKLQEICKYSYLKRFIVKEALRFNEILQEMRKDLVDAAKVFDRVYAYEPEMLAIAYRVRSNHIPEKWAKLWPRHKKSPFLNWLSGLSERYVYFSKLVASIEMTHSVFNLKMFAEPRGLLDAYLLDCTYRRAPNMKFDDIIMTFKLTNTFEKNQDQLNDEGIHLFGLKVKNGYVDKSRAELTDRADANASEMCPAISVVCKYYKKIQEKSDARAYLCPVLDMSTREPDSISEIEPLFRLVGQYDCQKILCKDKTMVHTIRGTHIAVDD